MKTLKDIKKYKMSRIMLPSRYITKIKINKKLYGKKDRRLNKVNH